MVDAGAAQRSTRTSEGSTAIISAVSARPACRPISAVEKPWALSMPSKSSAAR
jgi:hypothetical protein